MALHLFLQHAKLLLCLSRQALPHNVVAIQQSPERTERMPDFRIGFIISNLSLYPKDDPWYYIVKDCYNFPSRYHR